MKTSRPRTPRRRIRPVRTAVICMAVAMLGALPATAAVINPPFPGLTTVITGVNASFVAGDAIAPLSTRVEVWRSGVRIARTGPITPDAGAVEVNHELGPVENCWVGTTPDFAPGDQIRVIQQGGDDFRSLVRNVTMAAPVLNNSNPLAVTLTVKLRGADTDGTTPLPVAELAVELRQLGGGSRWIVAGDGTFQGPGLLNGVIEPDPDSLDPANFQAVLSFGADGLNAALAQATPLKEASWTAGGEVTFFEFGAASGPQAPCTAPLPVGPQGVSMTAASDTGASDADGITSDTTPTFTGLANPNADVNLYVDVVPPTTPTATVTADANGVFTFTPAAPLTQGGHVLRASEGTLPGPETVSNAPYNFTIDSVAPAAPTNLTTNPVSPASSTTPLVLGTAEGGSTVTVYADENCALGQAAVGSAATFAAPGIQITVPASVTTQIAATATDVAGNTSTCSNNIAYVSDGTPPAVPTALTTTPATSVATPSNDATPVVRGSLVPFEAGATIHVYVNTACTGTPAGNGTATAFTSGAGIEVTVPANQTSTIRASAEDAVGNVSGCSAAVSYVHDNVPPAAPTGLLTVPASPSNNNQPFIRGTAAAGSTVRVYSTDDCTGGSTSGTATTFGAAGLQIPSPVPSNQISTLSVDASDAATNRSACATIAYTEDSIAPDAPAITATNPNANTLGTASTVNTPLVIGTAPVDATTIRIFVNATCSGPAAATGSAASFGSPGIQVTVSENATNQLTANAVDAAGNVSTCSNVRSYFEDSVPPLGVPVILSGPSGAQKSRDAAFTFQLSAPLGVDALQCSLSTGADVFAACDTPTTFTRTGLADGAYTFKVRVIDGPGNANVQSRTFQVDNVGPIVTITSGPGESTRDTTPTFSFTANETVALFECGRSRSDAPPVFSPCATPLTIGPLALGTWIFSVRATDLAGNTSAAPATAGFALLRPIGAPVVPTRAAAAKAGRFSVLVRCTGPAGATCSGLVDVTRRVPATVTRPARNVRIARARVVLLAGQTKRVNLVLTASGRKVLNSTKRINARVLVTPTGGRTSSFPLRLTLKR